MSTFLSVKNMLLNHINQMEQHKKDFVKNPEKDFTRKSRLSFVNTIMTLISMERGSIGSELQKYFDYSPDTPTPSAFVQQRDKLKTDAFEFLFRSFTEKLSLSSYKDFHLFAVDGSDILIPLGEENPTYSYFCRPGQGCYHQVHLNAIYNLRTQQYAAALIEPRRGHNEQKAFHQLFDEQSFPEQSLFVFDRGYEGYPLMAHINEKNQYFLIRVKDWHTGGILKGIPRPDAEEFDFLYEKIFVNKIRAEYKKERDKYQRVHSTGTPYFLNKEVREYPLSFRVVRFQLDKGGYECLVTNLPSEQFDTSALKKLYHMRWGIETSFRYLKHTIGLLNFHSKKVEAIEMEIWARLILYNCTMEVTNRLEKRKTESKYSCKINITNALHICLRFLRLCEENKSENADQLIAKELLPIRPDRSSPRKIAIQRPRRFQYRPS